MIRVQSCFACDVPSNLPFTVTACWQALERKSGSYLTFKANRRVLEHPDAKFGYSRAALYACRAIMTTAGQGTK
jgi:hypothetical protein